LRRRAAGPGLSSLNADRTMLLRDFFSDDAVKLHLAATNKEEVLAELVKLLHPDDRASDTLLRVLKRREALGSTGVGRGIAIPHCRSLVVPRLRLGYGHSPTGIDYHAIDGQRVHDFFLIVAPPLEVSNQYLPVLGKIAQFAKEPGVGDALARLETADQFFQLLADKGV
jgi:mannitol/fructose-specific phosphotransferase system IIA component (Ntr-type)